MNKTCGAKRLLFYYRNRDNYKNTINYRIKEVWVTAAHGKHNNFLA